LPAPYIKEQGARILDPGPLWVSPVLPMEAFLYFSNVSIVELCKMIAFTNCRGYYKFVKKVCD